MNARAEPCVRTSSRPRRPTSPCHPGAFGPEARSPRDRSPLHAKGAHVQSDVFPSESKAREPSGRRSRDREGPERPTKTERRRVRAALGRGVPPSSTTPSTPYERRTRARCVWVADGAQGHGSLRCPFERPCRSRSAPLDARRPGPSPRLVTGRRRESRGGKHEPVKGVEVGKRDGHSCYT